MSSVAVPEAPAPPMSFVQRLVGMFTAPTRVFANLRDHPRWADALLFFVLAGILSYLPMHTVIQKESISQMIEQIESNDDIPLDRKEEIIDQQRTFMEGPMFMILALGGSAVMGPLMLLFWAFLVWLLYGFASGGDVSFRQSLAAVAHLSILFIAAGLVKLPMVLAKGSVHVATSPALLSPDPDPRSVIYNFLDSFDLFTIAILAVLAAGMAVMARIAPGRSRLLAVILFVGALIARVGFSQIGKLFGG